MSIKTYKNIASMQNPGSQRTGKAGGGRILRAADAVAPLVASHVIGFPAGPIVYESGKAAMGNIMGKPGQQRREKRQAKQQKRKIKRAERRAARRGN